MKNDKWYFTVSSIVFATISVAHLGIIIFTVEAVVAGVPVPLWVNGVICVVAGYLATRGLMAANRL